MTSITLNVLPAVRAWIIAVLAAEQITTTVICGGRLGAGHGWPARMSESHAGTARTFFNYFSKQLKGLITGMNSRQPDQPQAGQIT